MRRILHLEWGDRLPLSLRWYDGQIVQTKDSFLWDPRKIIGAAEHREVLPGKPLATLQNFNCSPRSSSIELQLSFSSLSLSYSSFSFCYWFCFSSSIPFCLSVVTIDRITRPANFWTKKAEARSSSRVQWRIEEHVWCCIRRIKDECDPSVPYIKHSLYRETLTTYDTNYNTRHS